MLKRIVGGDDRSGSPEKKSIRWKECWKDDRCLGELEEEMGNWIWEE